VQSFLIFPLLTDVLLMIWNDRRPNGRKSTIDVFIKCTVLYFKLKIRYK